MIISQSRKIGRWLPLLAACAVFAGCLGQRAPEVTYYSLLSMAQLGPVTALQPHPGLPIGIGPITIPEALKRSQLVTRDKQNIYHFDEFHRWAGILEKDMALVVGDNLGDLLATDKIAFFPWMHNFKPTYRVIVDIIQFDGELSGEATLSARWAIADTAGKTTLASGKSVYRQPVAGGDYTGLARAESLLLADLSKELAGEIQKIH